MCPELHTILKRIATPSMWSDPYEAKGTMYTSGVLKVSAKTTCGVCAPTPYCSSKFSAAVKPLQQQPRATKMFSLTTTMKLKIANLYHALQSEESYPLPCLQPSREFRSWLTVYHKLFCSSEVLSFIEAIICIGIGDPIPSHAPLHSTSRGACPEPVIW